MARWLPDDRIVQLRATGRLRDVVHVGPAALERVELRQPPVKSEPLYPLVGLCRGARLPVPVPEWRFHPVRKWRFDYAWPAHALALEVDGGVWTQGRHTRGAGAIADMEKASEAAILGWRLLYVVPDDMTNGTALDRITRALRGRAA